MTTYTAPAVDLATRRTPTGLTLTGSALHNVPLVQARLALRLPFQDRSQLAVLDTLAACWSAHPAGARLEQAGGSVGIARKRQWLLLSVHGTADLLPLLADTLAAVTTRPATTDDAVEVAKSKVAQQATLAAAQPSVDAVREMWAHHYGRLPAVADPSPTPEEVAQVTREQVTAAHARYVDPRSAHLTFVGAVDTEGAMDAFEQALATWQSGAAPAAAVLPAPDPAAQGRVRTCHRPGRRQTQLRLVTAAPPRTGIRDFAANQIAATVLGGSFSSRITSVLRERHGLAYHCRAGTDFLDRDYLVIEADVATGQAPQAMQHLHELLRDYAASGPTADELEAAAAFITGAYVLNLGSQNGRASLLTAAVTQDLPGTALTDVPEAIRHLTLQDVREAAARCGPDHISGVVCGDAEHFPDQWWP